ncbi:GspH/FimT family pseudopilin [Alteromonas oceani]|uniref:Type II secretion system protein H n=1 Tax=Alteromonas oceani TaxID=2071609 RepID=A0ABV7K474_9ALTE|nr:GspH/FimT family protein [Alteromonas oceani]
MYSPRYQQGLSLIEVLIVVAIISVVLTVTAPSVVSVQKQMAVKGAVENTYFLLQLAKSSAIRQSSDMLVDADVTSTKWCVGVTDTANCDCAVVNSCTVDGREQVVRSADFKQIVMQNLTFDANNQVVFDGVRGMAPQGAALVEFSDEANHSVRMNIAATGRVSMCNVKGDIGSYPAC